MKSSLLMFVIFMNAWEAKAFCKAEGLQRDIEVIVSRADLSLDDRRRDIDHAKDAFKEDIIECAVSGEAISDKAAKLAIGYINKDESTRQGLATDQLIEMIKSRVPKN